MQYFTQEKADAALADLPIGLFGYRINKRRWGQIPSALKAKPKAPAPAPAPGFIGIIGPLGFKVYGLLFMECGVVKVDRVEGGLGV